MAGGNWEFAVARFSRLYPLFALLLLTSLLFSSLGRTLSDSPWVLLSYATLTASWWYWHVDGVSLIQLPYGLSWSVATEVFFYVAYAAGLFRLASLRSLRGTIIGFVVFCALVYILMYFVLHERGAWEPIAKAVVPNYLPYDTSEQFANSFLRWLIYVSPYFHLLEFIAGVLTCQIYLLLRRNAVTLSRGWLEFLGWSGVAWIVAGIIFTQFLPDFVTSLPGDLVAYALALNLMSMNFLLAPGCCGLILSLALGKSSLQMALAPPLVVLLGEASYSIYLAHPMLSQLAFVTRENAQPLLSYAVVIFFLLFFSVAMYRGIEVPAERYLRHLFGGRVKHREPLLARGK